MEKSRTRKELLDNTIARYNIANRARNGSGCSYIIMADGVKNKGGRCAIGAEVSKDTAIALEETGASVAEDATFVLLPPRLKRLGQEFLEQVQLLHDVDENWNTRGLSKIGREEVRNIREDYNLT